MQVCTLLQTDNHTSTQPICFLQTGCPSCRPTNSVKALKALYPEITENKYKKNKKRKLKLTASQSGMTAPEHATMHLRISHLKTHCLQQHLPDGTTSIKCRKWDKNPTFCENIPSLHKKLSITTTSTVIWPLYRSTCVSQHLQLRTGGFCWCRVLLAT